MDATDIDILRELQADGRLPNATLAERVHLSRRRAYGGSSASSTTERSAAIARSSTAPRWASG
jgi:hypothetical protein